MDSQSQSQRKRSLGDWSSLSRRPIWSAATSRELAKVYGVSLNTINSWRMRDILPPPSSHQKLPSGNRNWYRIASVRALFENRSEEELIWEWLQEALPEYTSGFKTLTEAEYTVNAAYELLKVEKPLLPIHLAFDAGILPQ